MEGSLKLTMDLSPLKKFQRQDPKHFKEAQKVGAVQFLNWANNGSAKSPKKPPIRWGVLRGSSSAFVGRDLVMKFPQVLREGVATPAESYSGEDLVITFVWNTDYAFKMHEWGQKPEQGWGKFTLQDADAGNKWLEEHLDADKDDLMKVIGMKFKKVSGL